MKLIIKSVAITICLFSIYALEAQPLPASDYTQREGSQTSAPEAEGSGPEMPDWMRKRSGHHIIPTPKPIPQPYPSPRLQKKKSFWDNYKFQIMTAIILVLGFIVRAVRSK